MQFVKNILKLNKCKNKRKYYCRDHNQVLWNGWFTALHINCNWDEIALKEDVQEWLGIIKNLFDSTQESANSLNADNYIKDFNNEFNEFTSSLTQINNTVIIYFILDIATWCSERWEILWF